MLDTEDSQDGIVFRELELDLEDPEQNPKSFRPA